MATANTFNISLVLIVVAIATCTSNGQRVPTKVLYDEETRITDITMASTIDPLEYVQVLHIDGNKLVVGKKGSVMSYDLDLSNSATENTFPYFEPPNPALPCATVTTADRCFNFVNVIKEYIGDWYYCSTNGIYPQCWVCDERMCSSAELSANIVVEGLVTALMGTDQPFLIKDGKVFGAAATEPGLDLKHAVVRVDVSDFTSNRVETETDNDAILTHDETDFVGEPIEYMGHIYFFFREVAREYQVVDKIRYSRVARVCKDDAGGPEGTSLAKEFITYNKARLNCSIPGEYPSNYDYIQDIYQSPRNSYIIYAVLTDTPIMGMANSAICVYDMREVVAVFDNSKFKGQETPSSLWLPAPSADVPDPRPGTCSETQPQANYNFLQDYPLMNSLIPNKQVYPGSEGAWDRESDPPLMLLDGLYITQLVVDEAAAGTAYDVFFLGSKDGKLYKAYVFGAVPADFQTRIIQEINLGSGDKEVLTMTLHSGIVYVGTVSSLHAIPVACCNVFTTEIACVLAQSPYCSYDTTTSTCEANTSGSQCLENDVYSCTGTVEWEEAECFSDKTGDTDVCIKPSSECQACCLAGNCALSTTPSCDPLDCLPDYVQVITPVDGTVVESTVVLNSFVRAPTNSIWGTTTFECDNACTTCSPIEMNEITERSSFDNMDYLLGSYSFDVMSCSGDVDITLTFKANGQSLTKTVIVAVDDTDLMDEAEWPGIRELDQKLEAYDYQVCWWKQNLDILPLRNAESVYCYNCPSPAP